MKTSNSANGQTLEFEEICSKLDNLANVSKDDFSSHLLEDNVSKLLTCFSSQCAEASEYSCVNALRIMAYRKVASDESIFETILARLMTFSGTAGVRSCMHVLTALQGKDRPTIENCVPILFRRFYTTMDLKQHSGMISVICAMGRMKMANKFPEEISLMIDIVGRNMTLKSHYRAQGFLSAILQTAPEQKEIARSLIITIMDNLPAIKSLHCGMLLRAIHQLRLPDVGYIITLLIKRLHEEEALLDTQTLLAALQQARNYKLSGRLAGRLADLTQSYSLIPGVANTYQLGMLIELLVYLSARAAVLRPIESIIDRFMHSIDEASGPSCRRVLVAIARLGLFHREPEAQKIVKRLVSDVYPENNDMYFGQVLQSISRLNVHNCEIETETILIRFSSVCAEANDVDCSLALRAIRHLKCDHINLYAEKIFNRVVENISLLSPHSCCIALRAIYDLDLGDDDIALQLFNQLATNVNHANIKDCINALDSLGHLGIESSFAELGVESVIEHLVLLLKLEKTRHQALALLRQLYSDKWAIKAENIYELNA